MAACMHVCKVAVQTFKFWHWNCFTVDHEKMCSVTSKKCSSPDRKSNKFQIELTQRLENMPAALVLVLIILVEFLFKNSVYHWQMLRHSDCSEKNQNFNPMFAKMPSKKRAQTENYLKKLKTSGKFKPLKEIWIGFKSDAKVHTPASTTVTNLTLVFSKLWVIDIEWNANTSTITQTKCDNKWVNPRNCYFLEGKLRVHSKRIDETWSGVCFSPAICLFSCFRPHTQATPCTPHNTQCCSWFT